MDQNERKKLEEGLELFLDEGLERLLLSHPTEPSGCSRSRIRPLLLKGELVFQAEEQIGKQAFHRNLTKEEAVAYVCQMERLSATVMINTARSTGSWNLSKIFSRIWILRESL